jgi:pyruvate,water dikinase
MSPDPTARYIRSFAEVRSGDRPLVGGKAASLGEMVAAGLPVPTGFAVTVDAFETFRDQGDVRARLRAIVQGADVASSAALARAHDETVAIVLGTAMPEAVEREIRAAYAALCREVAEARGEPDDGRVAVAVRSSSVDEDGDAASFAGQQETYLWVVGADEVVEKVRECWASLYTPQAIAYRHGMSPEEASAASRISVAVQVMAAADVAGVTFTVSPRTGDRSIVAINASWGLGQSVVSGEVTPDEYWLSKIGPTVVSSTVAQKAHEYVPATEGRGVVLRDVEEHRRGIPCLDEATAIELAEIAMRVEQHYGHPVDIEWAIEHSATGESRILLLQSRPETTWKRRKAETARSTPTGAGYLGALVSQAAKGVQG